MDDTTADALERELAAVSVELTAPGDDECVLCYGYGPRSFQPCSNWTPGRRARW